MVIERIICGQMRDAARLRLLFRQSHESHLGLGENNRNQQPVIHFSPATWLRNVVRCHLALLHGKVNDFMRPGAVACRVNVRSAGLHELIGHNPTTFGGDPGPVKAERRGVWHAPQREQNIPAGNGNNFALVLKGNGFQMSVALRIGEFCVRKNLNPFAPENFFNFHRRIGVELTQDVFAALDERDLDAKAREELRKFAGDRPATGDEKRFWQPLQFERVVAGQIAGFTKLGQGWRGNG